MLSKSLFPLNPQIRAPLAWWKMFLHSQFPLERPVSTPPMQNAYHSPSIPCWTQLALVERGPPSWCAGREAGVGAMQVEWPSFGCLTLLWRGVSWTFVLTVSYFCQVDFESCKVRVCTTGLELFERFFREKSVQRVKEEVTLFENGGWILLVQFERSVHVQLFFEKKYLNGFSLKSVQRVVEYVQLECTTGL